VSQVRSLYGLPLINRVIKPFKHTKHFWILALSLSLSRLYPVCCVASRPFFSFGSTQKERRFDAALFTVSCAIRHYRPGIIGTL
jgi:hypothetical protein